MRSRTSRLLSGGFLLVAVLSVVLPFLALVSAALQPSGTLAPRLTWPNEPHWENFLTAWSMAGFGSLLASSAIIAVVWSATTLASASSFRCTNEVKSAVD